MAGITPVYGLPGLGTRKSATQSIIFRQGTLESYLAGGKLIDGVNSRDPGANPVYTLRPGVLMGKISTSKLYAPSIIDKTAGSLAQAGTSITLSVAGATELIRRQGSSGTLSLTGPPAANGVARTAAVAYSAVVASTGVVTITSPSVNAVQTLNFANSPAGTFTLTLVDLNGLPTTTPPITYSTTAATLVSNINTALNTALGTSLVAATGSVVTAIALTFSGTGYLGLPQPLVQVGTNELTGGNVSVANTTPGVDGRFVAGSFVGNNDGSQTPLSVVADGYGVRVVDVDGVTNLTVPFEGFPIAGVLASSLLVLWPTDTGLQNWIKSNLSTASAGKFVFDDGY